jgi:hypothetical protein
VSRLFLTKLHLLLAAFLFPAILMFLVTGALYTWGETGRIDETKREVALAAPLDAKSEPAMRAIALAELAKAGLEAPSGKARLREAGGQSSFEWVGSRRDVIVEPTADPLKATVTVKEASLHRTMVQLHKAKGGTLFKIYATVLAVALFLLVVSGVIMGWQVPALRRLTVWGSGAGLVAFAGLFAVS